MSRRGNIQGVVHLQNQNLSVTENLKYSSISNEWPQKTPNDSKNYHDESHDGIKFYQGNNNRSAYDTQHQNNAHPNIVL